MALDSYTGLKQSILDHLDEDLASHVDDFIDLAEARHRREIRIREMLTTADLTLFDRYTDLPDDFLDLKYLRLKAPITNSGRRFLPGFEELNSTEMADKSVNDSRQPCYFTLLSAEIEVDCDPDQAYDAELRYYRLLTSLSDSNLTNELLAKAPDIYLYAALMASAPFLLNDERVAVWGSLYTNAKDELHRAEYVKRRSGVLIPRASGP